MKIGIIVSLKRSGNIPVSLGKIIYLYREALTEPAFIEKLHVQAILLESVEIKGETKQRLQQVILSLDYTLESPGKSQNPNV